MYEVFVKLKGPNFQTFIKMSPMLNKKNLSKTAFLVLTFMFLVDLMRIEFGCHLLKIILNRQTIGIN